MCQKYSQLSLELLEPEKNHRNTVRDTVGIKFMLKFAQINYLYIHALHIYIFICIAPEI